MSTSPPHRALQTFDGFGTPNPGLPNTGLLCGVLRAADGIDRSLGGVSSTVPHVVLTDPYHACDDYRSPAKHPLGPHAPSSEVPELQLRVRRGTLIACPPDAGRAGEPYTFGGNFVWTSDGLFPECAPIRVHDRDHRRELPVPTGGAAAQETAEEEARPELAPYAGPAPGRQP